MHEIIFHMLKKCEQGFRAFFWSLDEIENTTQIESTVWDLAILTLQYVHLFILNA